MYGLIHACIQQMVKSQFGEDTWTLILSGTGLNSKSFLTFHCYTDEETMELIDSAVQVLHISLDQLLELLGEYFLTYVMDNGYEDMLRGMGSTFLDFIQNINYLHWYLMSTAYPGILSPSFVCSTDPDDRQPPMLDYYSHRPGMHPVAIGLLRAVGREFFQTIVDFEFLDSAVERLSSKTTLHHRRFRVHTKPTPKMMALSSHLTFRQSKDLNNRSGTGEEEIERTRKSTEKSTDKHSDRNRTVLLHRERRNNSLAVLSKSSQPHGVVSSQSTIGSYNNVEGVTKVDLEGIHVQERNVPIPSKLICQMLPYHLVFDSASFVIVQAGNRLMQFYPNLSSSPKMDSVFELVWPMVPLTPYNLKKFRGFVFQLAVKPGEHEAKGTHDKVAEDKGHSLLSKRTKDRGKHVGTPKDHVDNLGRAQGQRKGSMSEDFRDKPRADVVGNFGNQFGDDARRRDVAVHRESEKKLHLPPVKYQSIPALETKAPPGQSMQQRIRDAKQRKFESYKVTARGTELTRKGTFESVAEEGRRGGGNKEERGRRKRSKGREAIVEGIEENRTSGGRERNDERGDKPWKWKSPLEHKKSEMESKDGVKKKNRLVKKGEDLTSADKTSGGKGHPSAVVGLVLKGEIYRMEGEEGSNEDGLMIFVGTPLLNSLSDMQEKSMHLSDVPLHDSTRELVLLKHQRRTEFDLMSSLEETTSELRSTWEALQEEKQKADSLLYSMIPREVAHLLQSGERVQQSFSECTILFSDIVTFTVIASKSTPMQIVDMLNALYTEFDALTEINEVYKVETIGDAYMVVGGVPRESPNHARQVARQAVGMVNVSGRVLSPVSGKPIEIRVGMHSGPVVAGCVGLKMPRYCLFGDTVNTASRMESHGVPGKVHLSPTTKRALEGSEFKMVKRGHIDIKGKGVMDTYFLVLEQK